MRAAAVVAATELRRRLRDRSVIITAFVAPFALAAIMGIAFRPSAAGGFVSVGLLDQSATPAARAVVDSGVAAASLPPEVSVVRVTSLTTLRDLVRRGRLAAGVIVPPDFVERAFAAAAAPRGRPRVVVEPRWMPRALTARTSPLGSSIAFSVMSSIDGRMSVGFLSRQTAARTAGPGPGPIEAAEVAAAGAPPAVQVVNRGSSARQSLVGYFAPAMAIVFLFIGAGTGARSILAERESGTMARLVAAPVRAASIVAGKLSGLLAVAILSIFTIWLSTAGLFGASWGATAPVALLCVATAVSMAGVAIFVAAHARDQARADLAVLITGLVLALFGGNFFPPGSLPPVLAKLSLLTPNGWALQGFGDLALDGAGVRAVIAPVLVLVGFAGVCGTAAVVRARSVVRL